MMKPTINKKINPVRKKENNIASTKVLNAQNNAIPKQISFKIVSLVGVLISILLLILSYKFLGSYFETNDDARFVMQMKGNATPLPYRGSFIFIYVFTVDLYILLYKYLPAIPWYGFSLFFLLLSAMFNFFIILYLAAAKRLNFILIILLFIFFYLCIFIQNVYWMNFTRPAILTTASFIMLLGMLYLHIDVFKNNKWIIIFPIIGYVLAHFTRLEGGYLGAFFGFSFCILLLFNKKKIIAFGLKFMLPIFLFIASIYVITYYTGKKVATMDAQHVEYAQKGAFFLNYFDYRYSGSFVPKNINDTIAMNALNIRYVGDDHVISSDFLNRLLSESTVIENANWKKLIEALQVMNKSLDEENNSAKKLNIGLLILMILWCLSSVKRNYIDFLRYILFQITFILSIIGIGYFMKMPARIYNPLLVVLSIVNITFVLSFLKFEKRTFYFLLLIPLVFVLHSISIFAKANNAIIKNIKQYGKINKMMIDDMNSRFSNTVFIPIPLRAWEMHTASDPINEINFKNENCYVYLSIDICIAPETKDQLISKFGTYDHSELYSKICSTPNAVFISDDNFNNFLRAYYHYIYKQDYYFEKVTSDLPPFYDYTGLNYFRLKKQ